MRSRSHNSTRAALRCSVMAVLLCGFGLAIAIAQDDLQRELQATVNRKEFLKHLAKAEQGDAVAQANVGARYQCGFGVQKDYAEAVKWFHKSAKQGNSSAVNSIGCCYYCGHYVQQDYAEAAKWFRKSSEQGNGGAMRNLAGCYRDGRGVDKSFVEAYAWYDLANKTIKPGETDPTAVDRNREVLEEKMTPQQIAAGKKRSKELQEQIAAKLKSAGK